MQGVEHRAGDVPVEVVGFQIQGVGVREQAGQAFGNGGAVLFVDADVDFHALFLLSGCSGCAFPLMERSLSQGVGRSTLAYLNGSDALCLWRRWCWPFHRWASCGCCCRVRLKTSTQ
ncbi:hypothetical protein D3C78_1515210 [compost metagenome]